MSRDADLIDPTRDRVWAVDVTLSYTTYVVAETAEKAEEIAEEAADEDQDLLDDASTDTSARELTEPLPDGGCTVAWGRSLWDDRQVTVNEAVELIAGHKPAYDTQTALMPFADSPPPLYPPRIEDYLAAGRCGR